jgi:micrococcal nuclease
MGGLKTLSTPIHKVHLVHLEKLVKIAAFRKKSVILLQCLLLVVAASVPGISEERPYEGKVQAVFDGDTVQLETGEKVRYLGMDAPEVAHNGEPADCFGYAARRANSAMVLGKGVFLRYEGKDVDHYGRLLAYVFLADGTFVNLEMVKSGNACVYRTAESFGMLPEFISAQREAIKDHRGLWGACPVRPATVYLGNSHTFVFHRPECEYGREMSERNTTRFADRWSALSEGFSPCRVCKP